MAAIHETVPREPAEEDGPDAGTAPLSGGPAVPPPGETPGEEHPTGDEFEDDEDN